VAERISYLFVELLVLLLAAIACGYEEIISIVFFKSFLLLCFWYRWENIIENFDKLMVISILQFSNVI